MQLPEICIKRPVFATVMSLMVLLLGLISFQRLSVREYPKIDEPVVTVETKYLGASAEIVESQVTQPLEESLAGIEGIEVISSISRAEISQISVRFKVTRNADEAANDVRDRTARVRGRLPDSIDEPVIAKVEADATPIIYLAFSSSRHDPIFITDYADRYVKDRLQNLNGVADVRIFGERKAAMRIWLDPAKLAAYRLTPQDVEEALKKQNVEVPAGRIESVKREFTVLSETDMKTPEEFNNLILANVQGYLVRLKDVGRAAIGAVDERRIARFNGQAAVALGVVKQSVANPLEVSRLVRAELPHIEESLPEGMVVKIGYDSSVFIDRSIDAVFKTIAEAVILVMLVIFFFLRTLRATLIPLVTIPVSLIGACAIMYALNFSINTLTLLSMVLAVGLVVDDAIVVLENIHRHMEEGGTRLQAAIKGAKEIAFAVVAMTLTLAAVFMPIGFMTGRTGRLFTEFAITLAAAVLVSGFVALTLSPMMCSKMLKAHESHGRLYNAIGSFLDNMTEGYRRLLSKVLGWRVGIIVAVVAVAGGAYLLLISLKSELSPIEDRGNVIGIAIGPEGATLNYTDKYARQMEALYDQFPDNVNAHFMVVGFPVVNQAISFVRLKDWSLRSKKQQEIAQQLAPKLFAIPGVLAFAVNPPAFGQRASSKPVQFVIQTSGTYQDLERMIDVMMAELAQYKGVISPDTDLKLSKPQVKVSMDREKAAALGVNIETVGRTLETMLGGRQVTRFKREGKQYDVIVQIEDIGRTRPEDLNSLYVKGRDQQMVQLSNMVTFQENVAPRELNHFNQLRAATISANVAPGAALGEVLEHMESIAKRALPDNAIIDFNGESRDFRQSSSDLLLTFVLALFFIYLVLAAQFESFKDPLVIMLTVPLSMAGALLALKLTGGTLNVYSQIGLVTLVGLITKHGILIVEFSNQLQDRGVPIREAVIEAATLRLRPILMTTGAMVLGAVPLALATGAGAESRQQIGWVIVGGILLGTVLTLFVVPTAYTLISRRRLVLVEPEPAARELERDAAE